MEKKVKAIITILVIIAIVVIFYYTTKSISTLTGKSISGWVGKIFKL